MLKKYNIRRVGVIQVQDYRKKLLERGGGIGMNQENPNHVLRHRNFEKDESSCCFHFRKTNLRTKRRNILEFNLKTSVLK